MAVQLQPDGSLPRGEYAKSLFLAEKLPNAHISEPSDTASCPLPGVAVAACRPQGCLGSRHACSRLIKGLCQSIASGPYSYNNIPELAEAALPEAPTLKVQAWRSGEQGSGPVRGLFGLVELASAKASSKEIGAGLDKPLAGNGKSATIGGCWWGAVVVGIRRDVMLKALSQLPDGEVFPSDESFSEKTCDEAVEVQPLDFRVRFALVVRLECWIFESDASAASIQQMVFGGTRTDPVVSHAFSQVGKSIPRRL